MTRTAVLALTLSLLYPISGHAADPPKLPVGVTCEQIVQLYAEWSHVGKRAMRAWLFVNGYSRAQQREAEKCLQQSSG